MKTLDSHIKPYSGFIHRKHARVRIGNGVNVLLSWDRLKDYVFPGHLIDINNGGCGIYYLADRGKAGEFHSLKTCKLKFFSAFKAFELRKNTVIYDNELIQYSTDKISARRCGIKFDGVVKVKRLQTWYAENQKQERRKTSWQTAL